jgi:hypothetical protein
MARTAIGAIEAVGSGTAVTLRPGEKGLASISVAEGEAFVGVVVVEVAYEGADRGFTVLQSFEGTDEAPIESAQLEHGTVVTIPDDAQHLALLRVRVDSIGDQSDGIVYQVAAWSKEIIATSAYELTEIDLTVYETKVITSGSGGEEQAVLGDGTGVQVGTRKLITAELLTLPTDVIVLDEGDIVSADGNECSAVTIDATGGFILFEFNGSAWQVIYSGDATITEAQA